VAPLYENANDDDDDDDDAMRNELDESNPRSMAMRAVLRYAPFCVQFQERVSLLQVKMHDVDQKKCPFEKKKNVNDSSMDVRRSS
jgi:hypothetical protein